MKLFVEKYFPIIVGVTFLIGGIYLDFPMENIRTNGLLTSLATVGAILSGLTGTSISILLTLKAEAVNELKETKFYEIVIKYAYHSALYSVLLAIISIFGFFFIGNAWYKFLLFLSFGMAMGAFLRIFHFLYRIAKVS